MKPETRWKILCALLLGAAVSLAFGYISAHLRAVSGDKALDAYIDAEAKLKGFAKGKFTTPEIEDAPEGSKPLFVVEGTVVIPPTPGASRPDPAAPSSPPLSSSSGPVAELPATAPAVVAGTCNLDELGLTLKCRADGIASPGAPYGRLRVSGEIRGFGQLRDIPSTLAGNVELQMASWLNPATWHLDLLGGVSLGDRTGFNFGAGWTGRSRWGPFIMAEYLPAESGDLVYNSSLEGYETVGAQPATWRALVGARVRIK